MNQTYLYKAGEREKLAKLYAASHEAWKAGNMQAYEAIEAAIKHLEHNPK